MLRLLIPFVPLLIICSCTSKGIDAAGGNRSRMTASALEGVYELVSETTTLTKPEKHTEQLSSDQWFGIWFFQDNHYRQAIMNKRREWPPFPQNFHELGYQSSAGEYEINGGILILRPSVSLHPLELLQSRTVEFRIEGDNLRLIETMTPRMESLAEGQRITLLRKVK
jgi:hypothetical protein